MGENQQGVFEHMLTAQEQHTVPVRLLHGRKLLSEVPQSHLKAVCPGHDHGEGTVWYVNPSVGHLWREERWQELASNT